MGGLIGLMFGCGVMLALWSRSSSLSSLPELSESQLTSRWKFFVRNRAHSVESAWPDVVDDVASGIRAGLSLPQAVFAIGSQGPDSLRAPFARAALSYREEGSFVGAMNMLQRDLADPVGDRFVMAIKVAYELGSSDLGTLMRALSDSIREDIKMRGELVARQSWTVNGARLAVSAPWVTAGILSLRSDAGEVYASPTGIKVLVVCFGLSLLAYAVMLRIGRLRTDVRVYS